MATPSAQPGAAASQPGASVGAAGGTSPGNGDGSDRQVRAMKKPAEEKKAAAPKTSLMTPKYGAPQSAETIDALFAPLPPVESRGRAWLYMNKELKPVSLRLGITDGTNTELLSGDLQPGLELVTTVALGSARSSTTGTGAGNPLLPQRGGPGGFGGPGGRGR